MKKIKLISIMSELGAGTRGSSLAYAAMLTASHKINSNFFQKYPVKSIANENHLLFNASKSPHAKYIEGVVIMYERIAKEIKSIFLTNQIPIIISAAHSSAGGTIAGIKAAYPQKKLGVVWIDAHADLHSPLTTPSGNVHGMPLAISLKDDNYQCQVNDVNKDTIANWNTLTGEKARISSDNLIFFGVRDTEPQEDSMIKRLGLKNYSVQEIRKRGVKKCVLDSLNTLSDCELIYISFDVDSLDPSISKGTGTSVENGFTLSEAKDILKYFSMNEKLSCLEITEVNPTLDDKGNVMAEKAFEILEKVVSFIK